MFLALATQALGACWLQGMLVGCCMPERWLGRYQKMMRLQSWDWRRFEGRSGNGKYWRRLNVRGRFCRRGKYRSGKGGYMYEQKGGKTVVLRVGRDWEYSVCWKAGQSCKAGEVLECWSVSEENLPMHLNNLPSSGWVCSLTTDARWLQPQPTSCSAKAAAWGWAGCTCLMPTTINKMVNLHILIRGKCFKSSQPLMPWLHEPSFWKKGVLMRHGTQDCRDTATQHRFGKVGMWTV